MQIDFSKVDGVGDREPLPEGSYFARVADVTEAVSGKGHPMWKVRFEVERGPYAGRAIFDRLVFSPAALRRVKTACECLGVDVRGKLDLTPDMILGRACKVRVIAEDYTDQEGETRATNSVPYDGYAPADAEADGAGVPF